MCVLQELYSSSRRGTADKVMLSPVCCSIAAMIEVCEGRIQTKQLLALFAAQLQVLQLACSNCCLHSMPAQHMRPEQCWHMGYEQLVVETIQSGQSYCAFDCMLLSLSSLVMHWSVTLYSSRRDCSP